VSEEQVRPLKPPPKETQANLTVGHEGPEINKQLTPRKWRCFSAAGATREDELTAKENSAVAT
jgi:hypothetical protein